MADYRGTSGNDKFTGTENDDQFSELGKGNDSVDGGGEWDFVSYRWGDIGTQGIVAKLSGLGNMTIVDTYGDTDTFVSVQGLEGSRFGDEFTVTADGDFNIQPGAGSDRITIASGATVTLEYRNRLNEEVVDFIREMNLDITGIRVDVAAGTITEFNGDVDTFTNVEDLRIGGTRIADIMIAADDGLRTRFEGAQGSDYMVAGDSKDRLHYRNEGEDIGAGFNIDFVAGSVSNSANSDVDTVVNFRFVEASDHADTFKGGDHGERVHLRGGNDTADGGGGIDRSMYWDHGRDEFQISGIGTGSVTITHKDGGRWGEDSLTDFEWLEFDNGELAIDVNGIAGQAYRLYQAALDRTPDSDGLRYWISEMEAGRANLEAVGESFLASDEFRGLYGTPESVTDDDFVDLLYENVLGREGDADGTAYWLSKLQGGMERTDVLVSFSESNENKANIAPTIQDGIWFAYD